MPPWKQSEVGAAGEADGARGARFDAGEDHVGVVVAGDAAAEDGDGFAQALDHVVGQAAGEVGQVDAGLVGGDDLAEFARRGAAGEEVGHFLPRSLVGAAASNARLSQWRWNAMPARGPPG